MAGSLEVGRRAKRQVAGDDGSGHGIDFRAASANFFRCFIFNNMASFVFRFVFALFFPQERVFNNFSALFSGLFRFVFWA
jgi:hypothetical protein